MALVTPAEFKTAMRISAAETAYDAEITQLIERVTRRLEGECGRTFEKETITGEKYSGNGTAVLMLNSYPLRALTSAAIENESAITVNDTTVIRYATGPSAPGILMLQARVWTAGTLNVTVTYDAGFVAGSIKTEAGDVWELILDASLQLWQDMLNRRRGVASQSQMDGSISYFTPVMTLSEQFRTLRWNPVVKKYRKARRIGTISGPEPLGMGFSGVRTLGG